MKVQHDHLIIACSFHAWHHVLPYPLHTKHTIRKRTKRGTQRHKEIHTASPPMGCIRDLRIGGGREKTEREASAKSIPLSLALDKRQREGKEEAVGAGTHSTRKQLISMASKFFASGPVFKVKIPNYNLLTDQRINLLNEQHKLR